MGGSSDENLDSKAEAEANSSNPTEQNTKPPEPPKQDYIHVRARRGQATDSHSLAERVIYLYTLQLSNNFGNIQLIIAISQSLEISLQGSFGTVLGANDG